MMRPGCSYCLSSWTVVPHSWAKANIFPTDSSADMTWVCGGSCRGVWLAAASPPAFLWTYIQYIFVCVCTGMSRTLKLLNYSFIFRCSRLLHINPQPRAAFRWPELPPLWLLPLKTAAQSSEHTPDSRLQFSHRGVSFTTMNETRSWLWPAKNRRENYT